MNEQRIDYLCRRTGRPLSIDGELSEEIWSQVPRTPRFRALGDGRPALFDTQAAMAWNEAFLYLAFWLEERDVWSTGEERRGLIWQENTVEVDIAGQGAYYHLAVNPRGQTSELFFIWKDAYQRGGRYEVPEFDLAECRPMVFGGDAGLHHPRGMRWCFFDWQFPGLQVGVRVDGTLDQRCDVDRGWTVELAFPWTGLAPLADGPLPPAEGQVWSIALARCQVIDQRASRFAAQWTPYPLPGEGLHMPERYPAVRLVGEAGGVFR